MWPVQSHHISPISFYQIFPISLTAQTPVSKSFGASGAHYQTGYHHLHMIWGLSLRLGLLSWTYTCMTNREEKMFQD